MKKVRGLNEFYYAIPERYKMSNEESIIQAIQDNDEQFQSLFNDWHQYNSKDSLNQLVHFINKLEIMKLAIIIPVYNAEETIKRAILSVDTSVPYEIICINDGSTDQTQHVLTELQQKHPHIKVIHQSNQGAARSRNVGLEAMSEDVDAFLFLDADDEFYLVGLI